MSVTTFGTCVEINCHNKKGAHNYVSYDHAESQSKQWVGITWSHDARDYNSEADTFLKALDNNFKIEETNMYLEYAPKIADKTKEQVDLADAKVQSLTADAKKAQYDADCLALARDVAQIANVHREVVQSDAAARTERIAHLRGQNCIGASLVADYMTNNMAVHAGPCRDQIALAERAGVLQTVRAGCRLNFGITFFVWLRRGNSLETM